MMPVGNGYPHGLFPCGAEWVYTRDANHLHQGPLALRLSRCTGKPLAAEAGG